MIQTINADAYRSNEFLDLLAGKSAKSLYKVFDFLRRQASDAKEPVCPTSSQTQIPASKFKERRYNPRNETKGNQKHPITCDHNLVMFAKKKNISSSNKQSSEPQETFIYDSKKNENQIEHMCTIYDVFKSTIHLELNKISFKLITKTHDVKKVNTSKDLTDGKQKYNASSGLVEKNIYTDAKIMIIWKEKSLSWT